MGKRDVRRGKIHRSRNSILSSALFSFFSSFSSSFSYSFLSFFLSFFPSFGSAIQSKNCSMKRFVGTRLKGTLSFSGRENSETGMFADRISPVQVLRNGVVYARDTINYRLGKCSFQRKRFLITSFSYINVTGRSNCYVHGESIICVSIIYSLFSYSKNVPRARKPNLSAANDGTRCF